MKDRDIAALRGRVIERQHVGGMAKLAQQVAKPPRTVANRVAVVCGWQPLVDDHDALRNTSAAGCRSRRRRAVQPGSGLMAVFGGFFCSCVSTSWYFRSMT